MLAETVEAWHRGVEYLSGVSGFDGGRNKKMLIQKHEPYIFQGVSLMFLDKKWVSMIGYTYMSDRLYGPNEKSTSTRESQKGNIIGFPEIGVPPNHSL